MKHQKFLDTFEHWCKDKEDAFTQCKVKNYVVETFGEGAFNSDIFKIIKRKFISKKGNGEGAWELLEEYKRYVLDNTALENVAIPESLYWQEKEMLKLYDEEIEKQQKELYIDNGKDNTKTINPVYILRERAVENMIRLYDIMHK